MKNFSQEIVSSIAAERQRNAKTFWFGSLAFVGAGTSLVFCYAQVLISLMAPVFGFGQFDINIHLQAFFMWGFGLVTVVGLVRDRKQHNSNLPLAMGVSAVMVIAGTLYIFYDIRILILGYVLLVISALLNQNMKLGNLNKEVRVQSQQLKEFNSTLEEKVQNQVAEIEQLARLKRFLSTEVADLITAEGNESLLDSHRQLISCLFCDVRNFTAFSEEVEPEEVMDVLQTVHERMGHMVAKHGGTIGFRAGDGLMAIFNDPLPSPNPVAESIHLALEMMAAFGEIQSHWKELGHDIGLGIGISYGYATLGLIGSEGRYDYTAIGNVVNIAARLCDKAQDGEIFLDKRVQVEIDDETQVELVGLLDLKGIRTQVETFKVINPGDAA